MIRVLMIRIGLCAGLLYYIKIKIVDGFGGFVVSGDPVSCRLQDFTSGDMPNLQSGSRMQLSQPSASVGSSAKLQHMMPARSVCKLHRSTEHLLHQLRILEAHELRYCIQGYGALARATKGHPTGMHWRANGQTRSTRPVHLSNPEKASPQSSQLRSLHKPRHFSETLRRHLWTPTHANLPCKPGGGRKHMKDLNLPGYKANPAPIR